MFRLATLSWFEVVAMMGGSGFLRDEHDISCPHQKRCGERGRWSLALQPPPSLPTTPRETREEHVEVLSISPNGPVENQKTKAGLKSEEPPGRLASTADTEVVGKQPAEASSPSSHICSSSRLCFVFSFKPEIIWFCHVCFDLKIETNNERRKKGKGEKLCGPRKEKKTSLQG